MGRRVSDVGYLVGVGTIAAGIGVGALLFGRSLDAGSAQVEVKASELRFSPSEIHVRAGQRMVVALENDDAANVLHDWAVVDVPNAHVNALPGRRNVATFYAPDRPGSYQIVCTVPGHKELGMVASLVVMPD